MRLLIAILLTLIAFRGFANTYTVTSNADSGPGSLRDAITQAAAYEAANPTVTNLINFNIADQSRTGRTITLASALPVLPSNLTIDGTTQPGPPFGISAARVIITNPFSLEYIDYFQIISVSNIQIYGLFLQGVAAGYCFHFSKAANLVFGAAGKGNIIQGFAQAFDCDYIYATDATTTNVTIQGNIMGTDESGTTVGYAELNGIDFWLRNVANLQIGGLNAGEGNLMNEQDYPMDYSDSRDENFGYLNIQGNIQGSDITGTTLLSTNHFNFGINGYNNGNANNTGTTTLTVNITGNVSGGGFSLFDIESKFIIQGNHLGVGLNNTTSLISGVNDGSGTIFLISLEFCGQGLIGGPDPADKNYIAYDEAGVEEFWCGPITISRNSFFCNGAGIEPDAQTYPHPAPYVNITLLTTGMVGGTALPNSIVELFYDDECPGCEGKTYIGTTTADASGNWSYTLTATGAIVATATDTYGATSAFSTATINTDKIVVTNASCGRSNGSIKNIQVTSGTEWYWQDANGNIVANSVNLTNVGPGTYTFVTSIGGASCNASSTSYTITNVNLPAFDPTTIAVTQPTCGQNSGALQYSGTFDAATNYSWSLAGTTICPDYSAANPLTQLAPGDYTLQLVLKQDPTCAAQYGPYTLINQAGPSLVTTNVSVIGTTCGNANGSVTGLTFQNAMAPVYYAWRNDQGATIATTLDLIHANAGNYHFVFKDGGGCDTIFSASYTISDAGAITYDTTAMVINPASCGTPNGSITGIVATNATAYNWSNTGGSSTAGGSNSGVSTAGTTLDLINIPGGVYQLVMSNALGCQAQTPALTVPQIPKPAFDYTALQVQNDTCNAGIGAISDLKTVDAARSYTWNWFDANNNVSPIATTAGQLDRLNAGDYLAIVTDQYACTATSKTLTIADIELSPPEPKVADQYIPRNTAAVIAVGNPQRGEYFLLDGPAFAATILDSSAVGILHTPDVPQDETLYVGFQRGDCSSVLAPVNIKVFDSVRVFIPNAFTPNGPANERWHLVIQGITKKFQVSVFDRWGSMVLNSNDPNMSWDGTANGHALSGTFVYMVAGIDYYGRSFLLKGTLMIIR